MKLFIPIVLSLVSAIKLNAQNTAYDFTLTDCNGIVHHLYDELENGNIIVIQLVPMNSSSSSSLARDIENLMSEYRTSYPDKINFYSFGNDDGTTCNDMMNWMTSNNLNHVSFSGNRVQADYYGAASLPAIIVTGNFSHEIYYRHAGNSSLQIGAIQAAIEEALADGNEAGVSSVVKNSYAAVFPNPFSSSVNVRLNQTSAISKISICDITGKSLLTSEATSEKLMNFNTSALQKGIYFINFYQGDKIAGTFKLVKRQ